MTLNKQPNLRLRGKETQEVYLLHLHGEPRFLNGMLNTFFLTCFKCLPSTLKFVEKPANGQPGNHKRVDLKRSVRSTHTAFQARLKAEKLEEERKRVEAEQRKVAERIQKAKEEMTKSRPSLEDSADIYSDARGRSRKSRLKSG